MFENYSQDMISILVNSVPKYVKVENDLMNRIKSGELVMGDKIPTEKELCESYACSRQTIRKALDDLFRDGYIYRIQGLGTFVKDRQPQKQDFHDIISCSSLIRSQNKVPSKKILFSAATDCPESVAKKFGLEKDIRIMSCTERDLKAIAADSKLAEYLDVPESFPLLRVSDLKSIIKGSEKVPVEYYVFDYVTDRIKYFPDL